MSGYGYGYGTAAGQMGGGGGGGHGYGYGYDSPGGGGGGGFLGGAGGGGGGTTGGGFSISQGDSPGSKRSGVANQSLRPVTIKQLTGASQMHPDAPFKIDDGDISQVTFVGVIRRVNEQATSVAYDIEDGTGSIEVRVWVEADEGNNEFAAQRRAECCAEMWVRVVGQLRSFQNKRNVMGYSVRPVKDFNEITFHLLESISVHLWMTRGPPPSTNDTTGGSAVGYGQFAGATAGGPTRGGQGMQGNPGPPGYGYGGGGGIGGQADYGGFGSDFSPIQQQVLQCVKQASHLNEGIHVNQLTRQLGPQFGQTSVQRAIEWLISEGHLYSTIDEDHVKCCADS